MTNYMREVACTGCAWALPTVRGPSTEESAERQVRVLIGPHIDATGHIVRVIITTYDAAGPGSVERTALLLGRPEARR